LTLSVFLASGQPVLMAVLIVSSLLPQLAILQPPLEGTVECVSVQHDFHLEQSPTMNSTVDVSEVALCMHTHTHITHTPAHTNMRSFQVRPWPNQPHRLHQP